MRAPTAKALEETFRIDNQQARLIRALARAVDHKGKKDLDELVDEYLPQTESYVRAFYSDPYRSRMWRVTVMMYGINEILEGYGVWAYPGYDYINMGDTYAATILYDRDKHKLFISTWGDVAERMPQEEEDW